MAAKQARKRRKRNEMIISKLSAIPREGSGNQKKKKAKWRIWYQFRKKTSVELVTTDEKNDDEAAYGGSEGRRAWKRLATM